MAIMLERLQAVTGVDFAPYESTYQSFITAAHSEVQDSDLYGMLLDLHTELRDQTIVGKIRAVESWASGESEFRIVWKAWHSLVDKLYRLNYEEKRSEHSLPPVMQTLAQIAAEETPGKQRWILPDIAHEVADDLLRTKFVVPFVDGVIEVSDRVHEAIEKCQLLRFRRFHAKDSGYHARHYYAIVDVPGYPGSPDTTVALEIKVLTKMQDMLGELTHLLYEKHRTGEIPLDKKRKLAWQLTSPDFLAAYIGHSGHFLEASICGLKDQIRALGDAA